MKVERTLILLSIILTLLTSSLNSQTIWQNDDYRIDKMENEIILLHKNSVLVHIDSFEFNFVKPQSLSVKKATADSLLLKLEFNQSDGFYENFPDNIILTISHSDNTFHFSASYKSFDHITINLKDQDEHYFGLIEKLYPGNKKSPDLRGNVVDVDVYALGNLDYAENYASAYSAFYMSSNGYGSFFDTFSKGKYTLGINGKTQIYHQTDKLDWYIFYGPTGDKIHKEYFKVIGNPKYVPIWACGPIFWRDQNDGGAEEILNDIAKFTDLEIPLTACWVDRPYSDGAHEWSKMNFSENFANPDKWIGEINNKYGMEFMTWIAPMTFSDSDFPGRLPNYKGYFDLTNPDAVKEFEDRLNEFQYSAGVKGHKMDRSDENFPFTARWNESTWESESRNKYVYLYSKVTHDILSKALGKNQFNFARAAFHRTQPYLSAVWGGDSRNNWQGMSGSMANAVRCGFMGFPVWGNDTGGYLGQGWIDETLYIRWLQWSAWNGMFEVKIDGAGGSGEDRAPWKYSDTLLNVYKSLSDFRMNLLPYIYSIVNTSVDNGVTMKPLAYMYPGDSNTYHIWDEFIFGDAFLVAPVFSSENKRDIYLPQGRWYNFNDPSEILDGDVTITRDVPISEIPVFVKENSIYVTGDIFNGNSINWNDAPSGELTIHVYPGEEGSSCEFTYMDYIDSEAVKNMSLQRKEKQISFVSDKLLAESTIRIKCESKPEQVLLNRAPVEFTFDDNIMMTNIKIPAISDINLEVALSE